MIEIIDITRNPLQVVGTDAGICWGADTKDAEKNKDRALDCIKAGHDRVLEYVDVTMVISGYSARCIRELYTHIVGTTRLQESTRYVDCSNVSFYIPGGYDEERSKAYYDMMKEAFANYGKLLDMGFSREDAANVLPLGMHTKIVWKVNLRALVHFFHMRSCKRAYKEIRALCMEIRQMLADVDDEWAYIADRVLVPKCRAFGYCTETHPCPRGKAMQIARFKGIPSEQE